MSSGNDTKPSPTDLLLAQEAHRLVLDPQFRASARLKKLLSYLCDHAVRGLGNPVSQTQIAIDVLDLAENFDPTADAHVRIEIGRLRTALALYYADSETKNISRITIPKGSYRPVLEAPRNVQKHVFAEVPPPIAIHVGLGQSFGKCADIIEMVGTGLRFHCQNSPMLSAGVLKFRIDSEINRDQAMQQATMYGAPLSVHCNFVRTDLDLRVFAEVRATGSGETKWCHRYVLDTSDTNDAELARQISRSLGTVLADPILGIAPGIAHSITKNVALGSVLQAYNFMASQKLGMVSQTITNLENLTHARETAPAIKGLLAEMKRVAGRLNLHGERASADHYLEMAEEALALDVNDITCRMALGFAKLNAGQTKSAFEIGKGILAMSPPLSLLHKARMLVSLANTEDAEVPAATLAETSGSGTFYMEEFAQIIPKLRAGELGTADQILSSSLYGNVFWLHVFQAAVCAESGDLQRAQYSGNRIKKLVPGMEHLIAPLVSAFFPKENESHYIISGLRKSGLPIKS